MLGGASEVRIPAAAIPASARFRLNLVVRNRLGKASAAASAIVSKPGGVSLRTAVDVCSTGTLHVLRPAALRLTAELHLPRLDCLPATLRPSPVSAVNFSWSLRRTDATAANATNVTTASLSDGATECSGCTDAEGRRVLNGARTFLAGRRLLIPQGLLTAGATYAIAVHAQPSRSTATNGRGRTVEGSVSECVLQVGHSPLTVAIPGGATRTAAADAELILDARSVSFDPDTPDAPLDYFTWGCTADGGFSGEAGGTCRGTGGFAGPWLLLDRWQSRLGVLRFAPGELRVSARYLFTVRAHRGLRSSSASIVVQVVGGIAPEVSVHLVHPAPPTAAVATDGSVRANPDARIVLRGIATSPTQCTATVAATATASTADVGQGTECAFDFLWNKTSGRLDLDGNLGIGAAGSSEAPLRLSASGSPFLVLAPGSLVGGSAPYTLRLYVSSPSISPSISPSTAVNGGWAEVVVIANPAPLGGVGRIVPGVGVQFNDSFALEQAGWFDEDLPITYSYDYALATGEVAQGGAALDCAIDAAGWWPVAVGLVQPRLSWADWPAGSLVVRAVASDALGARGCTSMPMRVLPLVSLGAEGSAAAVASLVEEQLDAVATRRAQGLGGAPQAIRVLASMLQASAPAPISAEAAADDGGRRLNERSDEALTSGSSGRNCSSDGLPCAPGASGDELHMQRLVGRMLGLMAVPPALDAPAAEKFVHAKTLASLVASPQLLDSEARSAAIGAVDALAARLGTSEGLGPTGVAIVEALDALLAAGLVPPAPRDPPPAAPPLPPVPPFPPPPLYGRRLLPADSSEMAPGAQGAVALWRLVSAYWQHELAPDGGRELHEEDAELNEADRSIDESVHGRRAAEVALLAAPLVDSVAVDVVVRLASLIYASMVVAEAPAGLVGRSLSFAVQRGFTRGVRRVYGTPATFTSTGADPSSFELPAELVARPEMADARVVGMEWDVLPFEAPPRAPGQPDSTQATAALGLSLTLASSDSALPVTALVGSELTNVRLRRRPPPPATLSACAYDADCTGVPNTYPPIGGRCVAGVCECPLPWTGERCDYRYECWWRDPAGWHAPSSNTSCQLSAELTGVDHFHCSCTVSAAPSRHPRWHRC